MQHRVVSIFCFVWRLGYMHWCLVFYSLLDGLLESCRSDSSTQFLINQSPLQNHSILILMSTIVLRATSGNLSTGWFKPYRPRLQVFFNLDFSGKIKVCLVDSGILDTLQHMHCSFLSISFLESHDINLVVSSIFDLNRNFHTNVYKHFSAMHTNDNGLATKHTQKIQYSILNIKMSRVVQQWYRHQCWTGYVFFGYILVCMMKISPFFFDTIWVYIPCKNLHT